MSALIYRFGQGMRALLSPATPVDLQLASSYLSAPELRAFQAMSRADQLHSLRVLREVLKMVERPPPVLTAAALLHDVGKSRYHLALWQKTLAVLVKSLRPELTDALGEQENLRPWRAPFSVRRHHPRWGGEILRGCHSDARVVWLVERHQRRSTARGDHPCYPLLRLLQAADSLH